MTESVPQPVSPNPDRYKTLVVFLTVVTTVITAAVAGLQADANIRASTYNRDSQLYAVLTSSELYRQGIQFTYDMTVFVDYVKNEQEATLLELMALQQQEVMNEQAAADTLSRSAIAQARADAARKFSIFYADPRYAPATEDGMPDMQAYLDDSTAAANSLVARQNDATDQYDLWNRKGDAYTSVLALLAVVFFLFGLAQALSPQLRLLFAVFGLVALAGAGLWMFLLLIT